MRGAFIAIVAITLLVMGILAVKNIQTETAGKAKNKQTIQRDKAIEEAQKAAKALQKAMKKANRQAREAMGD